MRHHHHDRSTVIDVHDIDCANHNHNLDAPCHDKHGRNLDDEHGSYIEFVRAVYDAAAAVLNDTTDNLATLRAAYIDADALYNDDTGAYDTILRDAYIDARDALVAALRNPPGDRSE